MTFQPIILSTLDNEKMDWLKNRFFNICEDENLWDEIVSRHSEEKRAYHNLSHLFTLLNVLDTSNLISDKVPIEWAIWFHDIVYDAKRKDNEIKSAELFMDKCNSILPSNLKNEIEIIIKSTQKHVPLKTQFSIDYMLDLDLFILAAEKEIYQTYVDAIRKEYNWVPSILYKRGRKKVLSSFIARKKIYYTSFFYHNYEKKARINLAWELENLNN